MRSSSLAIGVSAALVLAVVAVVASVRADERKQLTEKEKIDSLIQTVEDLKDAKFIRNGVEHDCKAAAAHMRRKLKAAGNKIKTAADFITHVASKSSRSGEAYKIKFKDGTEQTSEKFLTDELEKLEKPAEKS